LAKREKDSPLVYVIVLHGGRAPVLRRCISSLEGQSYGNFRVLLVDNASGDEGVEAVRDSGVRVDVIRIDRRAGFAKANNLGIRRAMEQGAEYVVLLNDDAFPEGEWLEELVSVAEGGDRVGVVGSKVLFDADPQFINSTGLKFNLAGLAWDRGIGRIDCPRWDEPGILVGVTGAAMLLSCEMLRDIGLLDEGYPVYYEDLDLCIRSGLSGYSVVYAPRAVTHHLYSATYGVKSWGKEYRSTFSRTRFVAKFFPRAALVRALVCLLFERVRLQLRNVVCFRPGMLLAGVLGFLRAGLEISGLWSVRGARRAVSDEELRRLGVCSYARPELHIPTGGVEGDAGSIFSGEGRLKLKEGWYGCESGRPAGCWMAKRAGFVVEGLARGDYEVCIDAWFPPEWERLPRVSVLADGECVGERLAERGLGRYDFEAGRVSGATRFRIEVSDFITAEESGDYRDLGIKVCHIDLNPLKASREERNEPGRD